MPGSKVKVGAFSGDLRSMSFSGNEEDPLFLNDGQGHFIDVGYQARLDLRGDGRSGAWADLDGDGDLDLVARQLQNPKLLLLRNDAAPGAHWLEISLEGVKSNRMGLGAQVRACVQGRCQVRELHAGHGYLSQGPAVAHFGLGAAEEAQVAIEWPSGALQGASVRADRRLRFREDQTEPIELPSRPVKLGKPAPGPLTYQALLGSAPPGPTLVNLWAPWCAPCKAESPALAADAARCPNQLARVALSLEPDEAATQKGVTELGIRWPVRLASEEAMRLLDHATDGTPMPTTLAFDAQGRLVGSIVGAATPESLQALAPCPTR